MSEVPGIQATLKHLVEAERQAGLLVEAAEERARQTENDARLGAEQRMEAAHREAEDRSLLTLEKARTEARNHVEQQREKAQGEIETLNSSAQAGFENALIPVLAWITGTEGIK